MTESDATIPTSSRLAEALDALEARIDEQIETSRQGLRQLVQTSLRDLAEAFQSQTDQFQSQLKARIEEAEAEAEALRQKEKALAEEIESHKQQAAQKADRLDQELREGAERAERLESQRLELERLQSALEEARQASSATSETAVQNGHPSLEATRRSIALVDAADSQAEILARLVEQSSLFASRVALFLTTEGGPLRGWAGLGFDNADALQDLELDAPSGWRRGEQGTADLTIADCASFCSRVDSGLPTRAALLPIVLRGKVAALLYADQTLDRDPFSVDALRLLVHASAQAIEVLPLRSSQTSALLDAPPAEGEPAAESEAVSPSLPVDTKPQPRTVPEAVDQPEPLGELELQREATDDRLEVGGAVEEIEPEDQAVVPSLDLEGGGFASAEPAPAAAPTEETPEVLGEPELSSTEQRLGFVLEELPDEESSDEHEELSPLPDAPMTNETVAIPITTPPMPEPEGSEPSAAAASDWELEEEGTGDTAPISLPAQPPEPASPAPQESVLSAPAEATVETQMIATPDLSSPAVSPEEAPEPSVGGQVMPPKDVEGPGWAFNKASSGPKQGEDPLHDEARRLARLLVSEIKLYNEEQIEEGKRQGSIYSLLKEDIDRSRQMYEERIDDTVRTTSDYFRDELVRSLAGGNAQLLGM